MATIATGTAVSIASAHAAALRFPPPSGAALFVAVHADALKATANQLTQILAIEQHQAVWTGAVDERMLEVGADQRPDARTLLAHGLFRGDRLWSVVRPGRLTRPPDQGPLFTVYHGTRPWVVVGELAHDRLLAMPLNDARGNPKWYAPVIPQAQLTFVGNSKDSQLELAHLWCFPAASTSRAGVVREAAVPELRAAVARYFALAAQLGVEDVEKP